MPRPLIIAAILAAVTALVLLVLIDPDGLQWGTVGEWIGGLGTLAAVAVALGIAIRDGRNVRQRDEDAKRAAALAAHEALVREMQAGVRWADRESWRQIERDSDGTLRRQVVIENRSARAIFNVSAVLVENGRRRSNPVKLGPGGDGSGVIPAHGGIGDAWFVIQENRPSQFRASFGLEHDDFVLYESNEVQWIESSLDVTGLEQ